MFCCAPRRRRTPKAAKPKRRCAPLRRRSGLWRRKRPRTAHRPVGGRRAHARCNASLAGEEPCTVRERSSHRRQKVKEVCPGPLAARILGADFSRGGGQRGAARCVGSSAARAPIGAGRVRCAISARLLSVCPDGAGHSKTLRRASSFGLFRILSFSGLRLSRRMPDQTQGPSGSPTSNF